MKRRSKNQNLEPGPPTPGLWLPEPATQYLLMGPLEAVLILGPLVPVVSIERRHGPVMEATQRWEGLRCR